MWVTMVVVVVVVVAVVAVVLRVAVPLVVVAVVVAVAALCVSCVTLTAGNWKSCHGMSVNVTLSLSICMPHALLLFSRLSSLISSLPPPPAAYVPRMFSDPINICPSL